MGSQQGVRIALFVPNLEGGGAERVMVLLANRFHHQGFKVDLVLQRARGPYLKAVHAGVSIVDLHASRLVFSLSPLVRYFRSFRPHATLATPSSANIIATLAWALAGKPGRLVVREATTPSADDRFKPGLRSRVIAALRRGLYGQATHVVAPSNGIAKDLVSHSGVSEDRIRVIPNPVDVEEIRALAAAPVPDFLREGTELVLAVGGLTELKDFATLIRAFSKVARARPALLAILGEGEERERLVEVAAQLGVSHRLVMPGFVENPFAFMKRASVLVLSSRYEGLPNVLLQALAVGTPVVSTDCPSGGPREILDGGRWGRLVPVGDVDAMAAAIEAGLDGMIERPTTELVQACYGVDVVAQRYLSVLLTELN